MLLNVRSLLYTLIQGWERKGDILVKYEVLAPVGSYKEIDIILRENPDAIYVGMKGVTSRPARTDFTVDEIKLAIDLCHSRNIKIYVAINSNISNDSLDKQLKTILELDEYGADAFIVADYGMIGMLLGKLKNAEIHASTLLGVYNIETVRILKSYGVKRIIFYANLYLDEMIRIINAFPELDYELVAEGGTCFNDIRQCRLPHIISDNEHILTCRSGCVLFDDEDIPQKGKMLAEHPCRVAEVAGIYMAAGIHSFKIEGRTVPAEERISHIRDMKNCIEKFSNGQPLNSYLHYIARLRRDLI